MAPRAAVLLALASLLASTHAHGTSSPSNATAATPPPQPQSDPLRHLAHRELHKAPASAAAAPIYFCPFENANGLQGLAVGEDAEQAALVEQLSGAPLDCIAVCIEALQGVTERGRGRVEAALAPCDACARRELDRQRKLVTLAMDPAHLTGCKLPKRPADGCYVSTRSMYKRYAAVGAKSSKFVGETLGGWWDVPEHGDDQEVRLGSCKDCIPTDGVGSVFSFVFVSVTSAMESGCTFVAAQPARLAQGVNVERTLDFLRPFATCISDHDEWLHQVPSVQDAEMETSEGRDRINVRKGTIDFAGRRQIAGRPSEHAARMSMLRGGLLVCGRPHAATLSRLLLRARYETGQDRSLQLRRGRVPPTFVDSGAVKAELQAAQSAWFDPLQHQDRGPVTLNVVMHVRRGDVSLDSVGKGGAYAMHYMPLSIISAALEVLMAAWTPLATKLGIRLQIHVTSEGAQADFPVEAWTAMVAPVGELRWKLRPFEGQKQQANLEHVAMAQNTSALQVISQMLDADVILADGRSLFPLTAGAWAVNTLFLTYPWLLALGDPLDQIIHAKGGSMEAELPSNMSYHGPQHPAYAKLKNEEGLGMQHPGKNLLHVAHKAPDFRPELKLLYRHRQKKVLQGMLANILAKKRIALDRGAHFNWLGY